MGAILQRHFTLRSSPLLFSLIGLVYLVSIFAIATFSVGWWWKFALFMLLGVSCMFVLLRDARLVWVHSCIAFRLETEKSITLMLRDGRHLTGKIMAGGVILPLIILLNVRVEGGGVRNLVLLSDCMGADSFRRLRVMLRWHD